MKRACGRSASGTASTRSGTFPPPRWSSKPSAAAKGTARRAGPFCAVTAPYTGRSPDDKFVVRGAVVQGQGLVGEGQPAHLRGATSTGCVPRSSRSCRRSERFVVDCHARRRPPLPRPAPRRQREGVGGDVRAATCSSCRRSPSWRARCRVHGPARAVGDARDPGADGTNSEAFVVLHFGRGEVIIGGTAYAGEIKKSMFTVLNYLLPQQGVFPMHCSANIGADGATRRCSSACRARARRRCRPIRTRTLIGDDEHGWSDTRRLQLRGRLLRQGHPAVGEGRAGDLRNDARRSARARERGRRPRPRARSTSTTTRSPRTRAAAYPISTTSRTRRSSGVGGHPTDVVFLTADAFGVLPPIARLTPEQALYYFLSGYTAKVAGTERGVTEPEATFSTCFGAPFLPLPPQTYSRAARREASTKHGSRVWLVNTGWTGGPLRRRRAHEAHVHARDARGGARRASSTRCRRSATRSSAWRCRRVPGRAGRGAAAARHVGRRGRVRQAGGEARGMFKENFKKFADAVPPEVFCGRPGLSVSTARQTDTRRRASRSPRSVGSREGP